ncbi:MAG: AraC family transcriptional regulator [Piscinibacter sp.]|uniref:AraC family transcriptional regulator n=1 Tax=Piscinibacter sp. TaxID=1903157 RepID=UPI0025846726|nr:AraC family transcriptional regulator [Piscinibacter sp.]MCW5666079.1 AraC family transcriptional regulator [Piscinibacter sp.]
MNVADPLSDVLRSVRLRGSVFFHVSCRDEWAAQAPSSKVMGPAVMPGAEHVIEYHMIVKGEGWVAVDGEPPLRLREGDIVMLPHGDEHVVSSAPGVTPADERGDWLVRMRDDPKPIPVTYRGGMFEVGRGLPPDEATAVIVCGFIAVDLKPFNPLIEALPRLLHLPAEGVGAWVAPMLEHAAAETGARRAGSAALLQRVSEMVFVDGARRYLDSLPAQSRGWLSALRDRQVGRAIALMHGDPAAPWTLDDLGRRVGLSRSALHERFVALIGMPPMQYLTSWRMQCGARLLRESHLSVAAVALEIGYDSEAAFSRAFKRATGLPPATWRRGQAGAATPSGAAGLSASGAATEPDRSGTGANPAASGR